MAATPRYFHGTHEDLAPGTVLRPGSVLGRQNWPDKENHAVFMTRTAAGAKTWAGNAAKNAGKETAHVYEVEPLGDVEKRVLPFEGHEHLAGQARVVRKVSSHLVLNPGMEHDEVFGFPKPAKLAPLKQAKASAAAPQVKGQLSLFPARGLAAATPRDQQLLAAERERHAPAPERPVPPADPRTRAPEAWEQHDLAHAEWRRYQGLPPEKPVSSPISGLSRRRR